MAKRRGATARDPKMRTQPVDEGGASKADRRAANRAANRAPMERLSPGVYRSAGGGLVTQQGRPIQRQPQPGIPPESAGNPWAQGGQMDPGMAGQIAAGGGYMMQPGEQMGGQLGNLAGQAGMVGQGYAAADRNPKWPEGASLSALMGSGGQMQDAMYRVPNLPQMPQPSANMGGQYRLSPGMYGTREQAMNQYNQQMQQMYQPMVMPQVRKG